MNSASGASGNAAAGLGPEPRSVACRTSTQGVGSEPGAVAYRDPQQVWDPYLGRRVPSARRRARTRRRRRPRRARDIASGPQRLVLRAPLKPAAAALAAALLCTGSAIRHGLRRDCHREPERHRAGCVDAAATVRSNRHRQRRVVLRASPRIRAPHVPIRVRTNGRAAIAFRAEREGYQPASVDDVVVRLGPGPCVHPGTGVRDDRARAALSARKRRYPFTS
jgi:hypothetical protein